MDKKPTDWKTIAVIVGLLAGAGAFGLVMPWEATSKKTLAAQLKERDAFVDRKLEKNDQDHSVIQRELGEINGKLDILLENTKRGRR